MWLPPREKAGGGLPLGFRAGWRSISWWLVTWAVALRVGRRGMNQEGLEPGTAGL